MTCDGGKRQILPLPGIRELPNAVNAVAFPEAGAFHRPLDELNPQQISSEYAECLN
jgi:hypothetical protein